MAKRKHVYDGPNRAREWRKRRKLTLEQLAPMVGVSFTHLSRIEKGERELNMLWMTLIGAALECAPADLLPLDMGGLTPDERNIIETLRSIPDQNRKMLYAVIESQRPFQTKAQP